MYSHTDRHSTQMRFCSLAGLPWPSIINSTDSKLILFAFNTRDSALCARDNSTDRLPIFALLFLLNLPTIKIQLILKTNLQHGSEISYQVADMIKRQLFDLSSTLKYL